MQEGLLEDELSLHDKDLQEIVIESNAYQPAVDLALNIDSISITPITLKLENDKVFLALNDTKSENNTNNLLKVQDYINQTLSSNNNGYWWANFGAYLVTTVVFAGMAVGAIDKPLVTASLCAGSTVPNCQATVLPERLGISTLIATVAMAIKTAGDFAGDKYKKRTSNLKKLNTLHEQYKNHYISNSDIYTRTTGLIQYIRDCVLLRAGIISAENTSKAKKIDVFTLAMNVEIGVMQYLVEVAESDHKPDLLQLLKSNDLVHKLSDIITIIAGHYAIINDKRLDYKTIPMSADDVTSLLRRTMLIQNLSPDDAISKPIEELYHRLSQALDEQQQLLLKRQNIAENDDKCSKTATALTQQVINCNHTPRVLLNGKKALENYIFKLEIPFEYLKLLIPPENAVLTRAESGVCEDAEATNQHIKALHKDITYTEFKDTLDALFAKIEDNHAVSKSNKLLVAFIQTIFANAAAVSLTVAHDSAETFSWQFGVGTVSGVVAIFMEGIMGALDKSMKYKNNQQESFNHAVKYFLDNDLVKIEDGKYKLGKQLSILSMIMTSVYIKADLESKASKNEIITLLYSTFIAFSQVY